MKALGLKEARPAYSHGRKYAIVDFCLEGKRLLMRLALFCTLLYPFLALLVPPSLLSAPLLSSVYIYLASRRHKYLLPWRPCSAPVASPSCAQRPNHITARRIRFRRARTLYSAIGSLPPQLSASNLLSYPYINKSTSDSDRLSTLNSPQSCRPPPPSPPWTIP